MFYISVLSGSVGFSESSPIFHGITFNYTENYSWVFRRNQLEIRKTNTKNRRKFIWKPPKLINIYGLRKNIKAKLVLSIESTWKAAQQFQFHLELNGNCLCKNEGYFGITSRHTKHFHKNFTTWWPKWMLFRWKLRPVWLLVLGHKHK